MRKSWNFIVMTIGYTVIVILLGGLIFWFVWRPIKIGSYEPLHPERLNKKQAYLSSLVARDTILPNIIIINFDDLGYGDLSCYGNQLIYTPVIDSLAERGIRMTDFYSCSSVCTPSRAGLLTGRFPLRAYAGDHVYFPEGNPIADQRKMQGSKNEIPRDEIMISEALKANGYATALIGKWHLGDIEGHLPNDFGFDDFFGVRYSNDMIPLHIYRDGQIIEEDKKELENSSFRYGYYDMDTPLKVEGVDQSKFTENYTREAIAFIEKNQEKPFFLYLPHSMPHVPHFSSARQDGKSKAGLYGDVIEDLDWSVGQIMESLQSLNLTEQTLVFITSDNGADVQGSVGNLRGRKQLTYEGGQKVPMIIYGPSFISNPRETNVLATNMDIFPTILDLLDIPLPDDRIIDGKSILPIILGSGPGPHQYVFYNSAGSGNIEGVRDTQFKYHEDAIGTSLRMFGSFSMTMTLSPQLTDLKYDNESHNLIKKYPDRARLLKSIVDQKRKELTDNRRGWID